MGALIAIKAEAARPEVLARWSAEGGKVFAREAAEKGRVKEALIVIFPKPIARELTGQLRAIGLRWNKVLQHWEGLGEHDVVSKLVGAHAGTVRRVRADAPQLVAAE